MKVAISIADPLFAEGEALAKSLGTSRSELYHRALEEFIARRSPGTITKTMNETLDVVGASRDEFATRAALRALRDVEW